MTLYIPRSFGRTRDCKGCRFWSALNARVLRGVLKVQCVNRDSPNAYLYTRKDDACPCWAEGEYGAVDDPENRGAY